MDLRNLKLKHSAIPTKFKFKQEHKPRKSPCKRSLSPDVTGVTVTDRFSCLNEKIQFDHSYCQKVEENHVKNNDVTSATLIDDELQEVSTTTDIIEHGNFNLEIDSLQNKLKEMEHKVIQLKKTVARERREKNKLIKEKNKAESEITKVFNTDQLSMLGKENSRGRKWSRTTVKKALQLRFTCGATGYKMLLKQHQPLPSMRTLRRKMEVINMEPGILEEVFTFMKFKVNTLKPKERICSLTLDEMSLKAGLQYDVGSSCFRGNISFPEHKGVATHALVFMLSGITTRWKQTVGYHYTGKSTDGEILKQLTLEIIKHATDIGLHVISVTSDMGSSNQAMWKCFGVVCSRYCRIKNKIEHPCEPGKSLYFLADVPHLTKNLKAALVNGQDIHLHQDTVQKANLTSSTVNIEPVKALVAFQEDKDLKLAPKINESTLKPNHFQKMKVSQALHLFSNSVSAGIRYLVEHEDHNNSFLSTAWFIEFVNRWFDLMSSRHPAMALSRINREAYDNAISHLTTAIALFQSMMIGEKGYWKPVQTGVVLTTTTIIEIQKNLLDDGHTFVLTSRFTQDCLENLFGCVRVKNPVPSALEFKQALKIMTVAQFLKAPSTGNYQEDDGEYLAEFLNQTSPSSSCISPEFNLGNELSTQLVLGDAEMNSLYYLTGYCISKVKKCDKHCASCLEAIQTSHPVVVNNSQLTKIKEHKDGCLVHCTDACFNILHKSEIMFRSCESKFENQKGILHSLVKSAETLTSDVELPSCHGIKAKLLTRFFNVRLHIYAKKQKKIRHAEIDKSKVGGEMGSKSMAMRKVVQNLK